MPPSSGFPAVLFVSTPVMLHCRKESRFRSDQSRCLLSRCCATIGGLNFKSVVLKSAPEEACSCGLRGGIKKRISISFINLNFPELYCEILKQQKGELSFTRWVNLGFNGSRRDANPYRYWFPAVRASCVCGFCPC